MTSTTRRRLNVLPADAEERDLHLQGTKRRRKRKAEQPFIILVLQVGTSLASFAFVLYTTYYFLVPLIENPSNQSLTVEDDDVLPFKDIPLPIAETAPPMPIFNLTADRDPYTIAQRYFVEGDPFWKAAQGLRTEFTERYGGENAARAILELGTSTFDWANADHTACRIQRAKEEKRPFRIAFGGYSVTAGRGNLFSQSYPFQMEHILHTLFQLQGVELKVRNAAIGGCPSFPYGWCLPNFLGSDADVVSWDFSMNEAGGDPSGLEAYIRHLLQMPHRPKLIVKDTHMATERRNLLQKYSYLMVDAIVMHTDPAARPFLNRKEEYRPPGFQEWRKFGSPPGAPGQALHHPAVQEHTFIAWILAMHFLEALELLAAADHGDYLLTCPETEGDKILLPPPVSVNLTINDLNTSSILFGLPVSSSGDKWRMNPVHCRTTFEPILDGQLHDIVESGTTAEDLDVMLPKSKMFYNKAWVLDLSPGEKKAKRNLDRFGGLGFLDSKKAYYGLPTSDTIRFLIPYEPEHSKISPKQPQLGDKAIEWFQAVVWCEVNEKRESFTACNTGKDVDFQIGGVNVTNGRMMEDAGTLYLGEKLCMHLPIPMKAKLTNRKRIREQRLADADHEMFVFPYGDEGKDEIVGLLVEASVNNIRIIQREDACSVSHIVWEQTRHPEQR
ncbi:hypothetical protein FisN_2Lh553 [Fistulifera solaris]|uniref:Uncharacterized protein n=1 Tax=Fistulifera solaris TaxID=1519565 RepID=A0A1Z5JAJ8_FISSO|nr:hypothetical protein FisN_2Lh553 [Fistulifera solaris]|eukprot:GAX11024.1 hypothetical protein FisN_2Lh553 [Fistulifera solaris]